MTPQKGLGAAAAAGWDVPVTRARPAAERRANRLVREVSALLPCMHSYRLACVPLCYAGEKYSCPHLEVLLVFAAVLPLQFTGASAHRRSGGR